MNEEIAIPQSFWESYGEAGYRPADHEEELAKSAAAWMLEYCIKRVQAYLENKYDPPNVFHLWYRGEREAIVRVAEELKTVGQRMKNT